MTRTIQNAPLIKKKQNETKARTYFESKRFGRQVFQSRVDQANGPSGGRLAETVIAVGVAVLTRHFSSTLHYCLEPILRINKKLFFKRERSYSGTLQPWGSRVCLQLSLFSFFHTYFPSNQQVFKKSSG